MPEEADWRLVAFVPEPQPRTRYLLVISRFLGV